MRLPGAVEALAFRLAFIGSTGTLRTFLNGLAAFERPIVVRGVEVEPASATDMAQIELAAPVPQSVVLSAEPASRVPGSAVAVAVPTLSKFIVTVEFIRLGPESGLAPSGAAADPSV